MSRGRQKGQTKIVSKIKDDVLGPYELWLEEDQILLVNSVKEKTLSYHGDLELAIKKIAYLSVVTKEIDYTLAGFLESYNNIKNQLTSKFKI